MLSRQISIILTLAGFNIESILAIHKADGHRKALARFIDPTSSCNFLVTTFDIRGQGLNVHKAANHGYIVQLTHEFNTNSIVDTARKMNALNLYLH